MMRPRHVDLCTGIGGFHIAAERAGFETVAFSEIDKYASRRLKELWPNIPNLGDLRNYRDWPTLVPDVLTAGIPCQPFSYCGKRGGSRDDRHLWTPVRDIIEIHRPVGLLIENVVGIVSLELDNIIDDLEDLGYTAQPFDIPAIAADAWHERHRIWIVAYSDGRLNERSLARSNQRSLSGGNGQEVVTYGPRRQDDHGKSRDVAETLPGGESQPSSAGTGSAPDADSQGVGLQRLRSSGHQIPHTHAGERISLCRSGHFFEWPVEPDVARVVHGIPNRSHRIKGLGNSIIPELAEAILSEMYQWL